MTKKNESPVTVRTFDFTVDSGVAPFQGIKRDQLTPDQKDARTVHFDARAGLKLEKGIDALRSCKTQEERESCFVTWVGDMTDNDYSLGRVARAHASYRPHVDPARSENKVKSAIRDVKAMSAEEKKAFIAALQESLK